MNIPDASRAHLPSALLPPAPTPALPRCGKGGRSYIWSPIWSPNSDAPSLAAAGEGWGGGRWQKSGGNLTILYPPRRGHPQEFYSSATTEASEKQHPSLCFTVNCSMPPHPTGSHCSDELRNMLDSQAGFRKRRFAEMPDVDHLRPDFAVHVHAGSTGDLGHAGGVVTDNLQHLPGVQPLSFIAWGRPAGIRPSCRYTMTCRRSHPRFPQRISKQNHTSPRATLAGLCGCARKWLLRTSNKGVQRDSALDARPVAG